MPLRPLLLSRSGARRRRRRLVPLLLVSALAAGPPIDAAAAARGSAAAIAAEHRLASAAGLEILRAGGNAVDAAVAASLVIGVVNPSSAGLGGGGFLVLYQAADARVHVIDYREQAPARATRDMYLRNGKLDVEASKRGGLAVGVPGEAAGLDLALERFGALPRRRVVEPALELAKEGFLVEDHLARQIAAARQTLAASPALAKVFLHADGTPVAKGERLRRPDLAATLELFAERGAEPFYRGAVADDIVRATASAGGILSRQDLANYRPQQRLPVITEYRQWRFIGMPPPSSGGGVMAEALAILEPYRLGDLGHNSPTYLHLLAETLKAVFADRARYYGDADFVAVPLARLISPAHTGELRRRLRASRALPAESYGNTTTADDGGTSHLSVVDADGNAVACTSSINTSFGSKLAVPDRGIVLNNTMDDFSLRPGVPNAYGLVGSEANRIEAGKRPLSSMSPTIVLEGSRVRLVAGASGGPRIISATLQVLLDVLDFGMEVERAVAAPRIHHQWLPDLLGTEQGIDPATRASLSRRGHAVRTLSHGAAVQAVEAVFTDEGSRAVRAAADPRKGGQAEAF